MKRYFVWKDGKNNGDKTEWVELNQEDFMKLVGSNEATGRWFVFYSPYDGRDDSIVFETTEKGYKIADNSRGIYKYSKMIEDEYKIQIVSLDEGIEMPDGETVTLLDMIPDESAEFESELITRIWVREAIKTLNPVEQQLINWMYPEKGVGKTGKEISLLLGISESAVSQRMKKIYKKLEKVLKNF